MNNNKDLQSKKRKKPSSESNDIDIHHKHLKIDDKSFGEKYQNNFDIKNFEISSCYIDNCNCINYKCEKDSLCSCSHSENVHKINFKLNSSGVQESIENIFYLTKMTRYFTILELPYRVYDHLCKLRSESNKLNKGTQKKKVSDHLMNLCKNLVNRDIDEIIMKLEGKESLDPILKINLICFIDNKYYQLYHYSKISTMGKKLSIPSPSDYFKQYLSLFNCKVEDKFKEEIDSSVIKKLYDIWELEDNANDENELLKIYHIKWKETLHIIYQSGLHLSDKILSEIKSLKVTKKSKKDKKNRKKSKEQLEEPICYDILQSWRDICRDWPSLIYSYAIPTRKALNLIKKYSPIVEMGAGTGYWMKLLRNENVDIIGFDLVPASVSGTQNEFHANTKPFVEDIRISTTNIICKYSERTLLICFPPPDDDMAKEYLANYKGDTFIHIGEWGGFTGTSEFTKNLLSNWELIERLELPNWPDTEYDLTVWKRKKKGNDSSLSKLLECSECGKQSPPSVLRQCKCCRSVRYCTKECMITHLNIHKSIHLTKMIFTDEIDKVLDFSNPKHYRPLRF